jgi:hypothetical protein
MHTTDKETALPNTPTVARNLWHSTPAMSASGRTPRPHKNFGRDVALTHINDTATTLLSAPTVAKNL